MQSGTGGHLPMTSIIPPQTFPLYTEPEVGFHDIDKRIADIKPPADIAALYAPREESGPAAARDDAVRRRDRRLDRERRAAVDRPGPALRADRSFVGRQRLHADLRRLFVNVPIGIAAAAL